MPNRPVTVAEIVHWTALAAAGHTITQIASEAGRPPVTIRKHIPAAVGRRGRHLDDTQRARIRVLAAQGLTVAAILRHTGHTYDTIRRVLATAKEQP